MLSFKKRLMASVEIAAIDPIASMKAIDNPELREIAETIAQKLKIIVENA